MQIQLVKEYIEKDKNNESKIQKNTFLASALGIVGAAMPFAACP